MDVGVLPEIFALIVLVSLFQPIVSRVGQNANAWLVGWSFLLLHYLARLLNCTVEPWRTVDSFVVSCSLCFALLCFLRASTQTNENREQSRLSWPIVVALAIPFTVQCALLSLRWHSVTGECAVAFSLTLPGLYFVFRPVRSQPLRGLAQGFAMAGVILLGCAGFAKAQLTSDCLFLLLTVCVATVYLAYSTKVNRTCIVAVTGLVGWGVGYLAVDVLGRFAPGMHVHRALLELPQYIFAAGALLGRIEQLLSRVEHLAMHDSLTGLPNRRRFEEFVGIAMEKAEATETPLAFLVIDVDDFKQINDTLGHHVGDELLRSLAVRLSWNISGTDILARTGGDEFTAVLAGFTDVYHLRFVAGTMMSAASVPFMVDGRSIDFHISIGIAVAPYDATDVTSLRKAADRAMYQAKGDGGSQLVLASETAAFLQAG